MLAYIFLFVLGLSPVLQAVFDLPLQLALQRAVLLVCLAWLFIRAYGDGLPRGFADNKFYPLWAAAGFSFVSLLASPFKGDILNEWGNYAAGLLIFLFAGFLDKGERGKVERAVVCGAWLVFSVSLLQAFAPGKVPSRPPLTNFNALALYSIMLIPFALERKNWALAGALAALLAWTQSLGAALAGLAVACVYAISRFRSREPEGNARLLPALAILAVPVLYLLRADSVAGRLTWWRSAWEMFAARPLLGFGHASFSWAQAAFQPEGAFREHAIYAHNYYLEFLAENGLPAAAAWFGLLFFAARAKKGLVKYSVMAALVHSLVDFGLSVPANFWLFCWLLGSPSGESTPAAQGAEQRGSSLPLPGDAQGEGRPSRRALGAWLVFVSLLLAALFELDLRSLAFEKARIRAAAAAVLGGSTAAETELRPALEGKLFRAPALELLGRLSLAAGKESGFSPAVYYEMALLENRYSASAWSALRRIYSVPGREVQAAGLESRRLEVFK